MKENKIDFSKVVTNVINNIKEKEKQEIEKAIVDVVKKFPNYKTDEVLLRLIQLGINNMDLSSDFSYTANKIINDTIDNK